MIAINLACEYGLRYDIGTMKQRKAQIIIPAALCPWPHELRVAQILSLAGHTVEFLPTRSSKTADILLDGIEYEIKSPLTNKPKKILRNLKRALLQSKNVIIDSSRIKGARDDTIRKLLVGRAKDQKTLKRLLFITKHGQIIDIMAIVQ